VCKGQFDIGWKVVDQMTLAGGKAVTYLLRNTREGFTACAVTMKKGDAVGNATTVSAWIEDPCKITSRPFDIDRGEFEYYAGPVGVTGSCVHWGGRYGDDEVKKTRCG
jgi:hypothetical protein